MRDSTDATRIPRDTPVVAGYGDGEFIWPPSWWDLFPNAVHLVIVVSPGHIGDIADVETGDFTPADAPAFVRAFARAGRRAATLYCSRATWPLVIAALQDAGIDPAGPLVEWWIATLDGTVNVQVPEGGKAPVAVQTIDTGAYDESVILDPSWVGDDMALDASFWTGFAQLVVMTMHNQDYGKVDPGGHAVASLATTLQDRYVNGNGAQPGLNAILDGWTGNGTAGTTAVVTDEEINVAAHVVALEQKPPGAGVDPGRLAALLKQLGAELDTAASDSAL